MTRKYSKVKIRLKYLVCVQNVKMVIKIIIFDEAEILIKCIKHVEGKSAQNEV